MSSKENRTVAQRFIEEIFNDRKAEMTSNLFSSDIIYYGMGEVVRSVKEFKRWVAEDLSAFLVMKITILDDFGNNKVAIRWNLEAKQEKDFAEFPATHKMLETQGVDTFHFGNGIKEAWIVCDLSVLST
ncbi:MAG TPA: ester cyclase [Nitrososphaera sp.]|nr:ester cyclase [Nitrososphaera sp.]